MSNNLHKVQNVFVSDGTAFPANDAAITTVTDGKIGIFGGDMKALNPAGGDTVTTQPNIYIVEGKTDTDGNFAVKWSYKIDHAYVTGYVGKSYVPATREVWAIGVNRALASAGTIAATASTNYKFSIVFKHEKQMASQRPAQFTFNFTSAAGATQLTIATQIAALINNHAEVKKMVTAVVVGDGTGTYGLTSATDYGVEITAKDINQYSGTNYNNVKVYFSVHVDDSTGFSSTTTCAQIQANSYGIGTPEQVRIMEDKAFQYEGVLNRTMWPIPVLDYSTSSTLILSAAIGVNVAGTTGQDTVTFSSSVAAILRAGEKVQIDSVNYEIKYFISTTVAVLTSVLTTTFAASDVCKIRAAYDLVIIDFDDRINGPTGNVSIANKSIVIASPAINTGQAYSATSASSQDIMDILNPWVLGTPRALANIAI